MEYHEVARLLLQAKATTGFKWTSNEVALIATAATVAVAILSVLTAYLASKRDRRRSLYADAVQAIAGWKEMLYRVRRRGDDEGCKLVVSFHDLQDKLTYYQAWISADSKYMSRSYARLVRNIKGETEALITKAWADPVRPLPGNAKPEDVHPDIDQYLRDFGQDVRSHLSPLPWRKIALAWRNRETESQ